VRVTGTRFNLKNYSHKPTAEVVLISGGVNVTLPGNRVVTLTPNERITLHKQAEIYEMANVAGEESIIWTQERLNFHDEQLSTILRKMEYWFDIQVRCGPGVDLRQRLSLTIKYENKEEIFKLLSEIASFRYDIKGDKVVLRK
jgi:ferric-dicitrate binding protein FerR (iron transport regulator)